MNKVISKRHKSSNIKVKIGHRYPYKRHNARLLRLVARYPCLYKPNFPGYLQKETVNSAWNEISNLTSESVDACKKRLCNIFAHKNLTNQKTKKSSSHFTIDWESNVVQFYRLANRPNPKVSSEDKVSKIDNEMQCLDLTNDEMDGSEFDRKAKRLQIKGQNHNKENGNNNPFNPNLKLDGSKRNKTFLLKVVALEKLQKREFSEEPNQKISIKRRNSNYPQVGSNENDSQVPQKRLRAKSLPNHQEEEQEQEQKENSFAHNVQESFAYPVEISDDENQREVVGSEASQRYAIASSSPENVDHFFGSLKPYMNAMNFRQRLVFKEKVYRALIETFDDVTNFPNMNDPEVSPSAGCPVTTTNGWQRNERISTDEHHLMQYASSGVQATQMKDKTTPTDSQPVNELCVSVEQQHIIANSKQKSSDNIQQSQPTTTFLIKPSVNWSQPQEISQKNTIQSPTTQTGSSCKIPKQSTRPKTFVVIPK